jgi:DNA replication initiation complex subunit (GINS family)
MNKMTIAEQYEAIIGKVKGILSDEEIKFLNERKELHEKKNASRKPTKTQEANKVLAEGVLEFLASKPNQTFTVSELMKSVPCFANYEGDLTHSKANAIIKMLKDANLVVRSEDKGKAYFGYKA